MIHIWVVTSLVFPVLSHAFIPDNAERVGQRELILAGSGARAKRSDTSIALACTDQSCSQLRFVYFQNHEAYFFGKPYDGVLNPKNIADETFVLKNVEHRSHHRPYLILFVGTFGSIPLVQFTTVPIIVFLALDALLFLSPNQTVALENNDFIGAIKNKKVTRVMTRVQTSKVFLNQDGWDWSETPRKVKRSKFCLAVAAIDHPDYMDDHNQITVRMSEHSTSQGPASFFRNDYVNRCVEGLNK